MLGGEKSQDCAIPGVVLDFSDRGMRVRVATPVAIHEAVRVSLNRQTVLAEVCYCQPLRGGQFALGLELEQPVANVDDLSKLTQALASVGASSPAKQAS